MPEAVFLVFPNRGLWWVDLEGRAQGPFASQGDAIEAAVGLARAAERSGREARILAPGTDRDAEVDWRDTRQRKIA